MERFGTQEARDIWMGSSTKPARRALPQNLHAKAALQLDTVLNTATLADCSNYPPGWCFKELQGNLRGMYQIRVNDQYRIRFQWDPNFGAVGITIGEFHGENE